tara:strand:- start:462 stop:803 length:342 start_codon:yes stop_codon:yes gene_type:complete
MKLIDTKAVITISSQAALRLEFLLSKNNFKYIRLGLTSKGCSGLTYKMCYSNVKEKFDELVEQKNIKMLIAPNVLMHVIGTKMDFVTDNLKSEFVFSNPNSKGECGCGESFTI